jgi:hypothetical protein
MVVVTVLMAAVFVEALRELAIGARNVGGGAPRTFAAVDIVLAVVLLLVLARGPGDKARWVLALIVLTVLDIFSLVLIGLWSAI